MDLITEETALRKAPSALGVDSEGQVEQLPAYRLEEVLTRKQLEEFLDLPEKVYAEWDTKYVFTPKAYLKMMIGKLGVPEKHLLVAKLGNEVVARVAFKIHKHKNTTRLHFGFFECLPDHSAAVRPLFLWARKMYRGIEMMGPFQFRQEDPFVGTLVQGFEQEPYFLMSYNPPEYDQILRSVGLQPVMDLYTYGLVQKDGCPPLIETNSAKAVKELGLTFRALNPKKLWNEAVLISKIFNEALAENWGFEEFEKEQLEEMVMLLKYFIDPRLVSFAMVGDREVGCLIMIPNYNPMLKPSRGRITLDLLSKYLRRKKIIHTVRGYALGVRNEYRSKGIGSALTIHMFNTGGGIGIEKCEVSWVLANNSPMNDLSVAMGGKQQKTYRVYSTGSMSH